MGLLDLAYPLFAWADVRFAALLSEAARIALWGVLAGIVSMFLYRYLSPQRRLAQIGAEERRLKQLLRQDEADLADGLASARRLLRLALLRLGLVFPPAILACLPVLSLMAWLYVNYAHELPPPGQEVSVRVAPENKRVRWVVKDGQAPRVKVKSEAGELLESRYVNAPVTLIHKRMWWNRLIGNPLGYLPDAGPVERIEIALAKKRYLRRGPDWMASWETLFLATLLLSSLTVRFAFRIR